ncbi:MAG TPA: hypothetical protein VFN67_37935 [Polyangiales bacterium]|nr:hypothetical protein [Polyangiales bacterium]
MASSPAETIPRQTSTQRGINSTRRRTNSSGFRTSSEAAPTSQALPFHATVAFTRTLKAAIDGHTFFRPEPGPGKKSYTGSELDVGLSYAIAPSLSLKGLYAVFAPSKGGPLATDELQHYVEVELAQTIK